eukprot:11815223-Karenia_brevis.AAC.1
MAALELLKYRPNDVLKQDEDLIRTSRTYACSQKLTQKKNPTSQKANYPDKMPLSRPLKLLQPGRETSM